MGKIETVYTPEEIRNYAARDMVVSALARDMQIGSEYSVPTEDNGCILLWRTDVYHDRVAEVHDYTGVKIYRFSTTGRKIGVIRDILDDGSFYLSILGTGSIQCTKGMSTQLNIYCEFPILPDLDGVNLKISTGNNQTYWLNNTNFQAIYGENRLFATSFSTAITEENALDYTPAWLDMTSAARIGLFEKYAKLGGQDIQPYQKVFNLTQGLDSTLVIGDMYREFNYYDANTQYTENGYKNIGGALSDINRKRLIYILGLNGFDVGTTFDFTPQTLELAEKFTGSYAQHYLPFNLILTRSEAEAQNYLDTGELPSDAFIYPYDVDNIPVNDSGLNPGGDPTDEPDDGDTPGEDGTPSDDTDPMPVTAPDYTPQSLTNNNLYWLTAAGIQNFLDWFWTDATDVQSWSDLIDKIEGLYENLAQAVINVRYMPVDATWIGGTGTDTKIIVGMLEKEQAVATLNKMVSQPRPIGEIMIEPIFDGSWANYTPYSSIMLYLPFHGMVELDNDLVMSHKISVQAVYDILAGTIQYFVHRDSYDGPLVYTTVAKMAVDIPITLQTKTDRDSAIIQNVGSVTAGLIGAGASLAAGSPIGLTMGLANMSGFQPTSAPMQVKGNIAESGAFYAPTKCAIYIKRPAYNRPKIYAQRVGFPCNKQYVLGEKCKGFTTCYKPRISFAGNTYTEGGDIVHIKPTKEEIETIYEMLEKGVII